MKDRLQVVALIRDPGSPDGLALKGGGVGDPALGQRDQGGQGPVDDGPDRLHVQPLVAGQQHLGLIGDRQVGAPGGDLLDRRGGIRRDLWLDIQAGLREEPPVEPAVDAGVVRVRVPFEIEGEALRVGRGSRRWLIAAPACGEPKPQGAQRDQQGEPSHPDHDRVTPRLSQVTILRSTRETRAKRASAIAERTTTAAKERAVSSCACAWLIRWPRPSLEPTYSANTAPITETVIATFAPLNA